MLRIGSHESLRRFLNEVVGRVLRLVDEILQAAGASHQGLEPRQRATLDIGCWVVLGMLGVGLQIGRWSPWTVALAAAGYLIWVAAYSEATVQATLRQHAAPGPRLAGSD